MKIKLDKASSYDWEEVREIHSLEELVAIANEFKCSLVISPTAPERGYELDVTIYDDYME